MARRRNLRAKRPRSTGPRRSSATGARGAGGAPIEDLEPSVRVRLHGDVTAQRASERGRVGPAPACRRLPDVLQIRGRRLEEDFESSVLIARDRGVAREHAADRRCARPAPACRRLPDVPERAIGSLVERLEPAVVVRADRNVTGERAAERRLARPAPPGGRLPSMEERVVAPLVEDLERSVLVRADGHVAREDATERRPTRPRASGRGLPVVEESVVGAARERLETSIGIACDGDLADEVAAERSFVRPAPPRARLPPVKDGAVGTQVEDLESAVRVERDPRFAREDAPEVRPARPGGAFRRRLPVVAHGVVGATHERFEPSVFVDGDAAPRPRGGGSRRRPDVRASGPRSEDHVGDVAVDRADAAHEDVPGVLPRSVLMRKVAADLPEVVRRDRREARVEVARDPRCVDPETGRREGVDPVRVRVHVGEIPVALHGCDPAAHVGDGAVRIVLVGRLLDVERDGDVALRLPAEAGHDRGCRVSVAFALSLGEIAGAADG